MRKGKSMNPIQQTIANRNKKIVIGAGIIFAGLWMLLVMYVISDSEKDNHITQPGIVAVQPSTPGLSSSPVSTYHPTHSHSLLHHLTVEAQTVSYTAEAPKASMGSTSMRIYQTSNVSTQNVGGGYGGGIATTNGQMNSNKGIRYAALAYSGAIYIPMTNNAVTAVGSSYADDVSSHKMSIIKRHNDTGLPGYNPDPVPDPEEPESPIGDVVWPLMVLLAGAYSYVIYRRKQTTNPGV